MGFQVYNSQGQELQNLTGSAGGDLTGTYPNPAIANSAVTRAKTSGLPYGVLGFATSTSSFATTGTHTTYQDDTGLSVSITYEASRVLRATITVHPWASGGANDARFQVYRGSTSLAIFQAKAPAITGVDTRTWSITFNGPSTGATETFKVKVAGDPNNTAITSYGDANFLKRLVVEDVGPQ